MSQPIAGNQSFSGVTSIASHVANLDVADAVASNLTVDNLQVKQTHKVTDGGYTYVNVTGYAPTDFIGQVPVTGACYLMASPGLDQPTVSFAGNGNPATRTMGEASTVRALAVANDIVVFPGGAEIVSVALGNNDVPVVGPTLVYLEARQIPNGTLANVTAPLVATGPCWMGAVPVFTPAVSVTGGGINFHAGPTGTGPNIGATVGFMNGNFTNSVALSDGTAGRRTIVGGAQLPAPGFSTGDGMVLLFPVVGGEGDATSIYLNSYTADIPGAVGDAAGNAPLDNILQIWVIGGAVTAGEVRVTVKYRHRVAHHVSSDF